MPTTQQLGTKLNGLIDSTNNIDPAYASTIKSGIMNKVNGLQPQFQELSNIERTAPTTIVQGMADYGKQFNGGQFQEGQGGVSPLQYISSLLGNYNSQMGRADTLRNTISTMGGGLNSLASSIGDTYRNAIDNTFKQVSALQPMFQQSQQMDWNNKQLQNSNEQAALDRKNQLAVAGMNKPAPIDVNALMKQFQDQQTADETKQLLATLPNSINGTPMEIDKLKSLGFTPVIQGTKVVAYKLGDRTVNIQGVPTSNINSIMPSTSFFKFNK